MQRSERGSALKRPGQHPHRMPRVNSRPDTLVLDQGNTHMAGIRADVLEHRVKRIRVTLHVLEKRSVLIAHRPCDVAAGIALAGAGKDCVNVHTLYGRSVARKN